MGSYVVLVKEFTIDNYDNVEIVNKFNIELNELNREFAIKEIWDSFYHTFKQKIKFGNMNLIQMRVMFEYKNRTGYVMVSTSEAFRKEYHGIKLYEFLNKRALEYAKGLV
jgi:hypothetical protein